LKGAVGKIPLSWGNLLLGHLVKLPPPTIFRTKMRKKILLQTLTLSSLRLLDLKPKDLSNKKLPDIVLNLLPEETRKSGKPREYFEKEMLSPENFNELSEDEKSIYVDLVKTILDKAFKN
jgi:hypothetical protein